MMKTQNVINKVFGNWKVLYQVEEKYFGEYHPIEYEKTGGIIK